METNKYLTLAKVRVRRDLDTALQYEDPPGHVPTWMAWPFYGNYNKLSRSIELKRMLIVDDIISEILSIVESDENRYKYVLNELSIYDPKMLGYERKNDVLGIVVYELAVMSLLKTAALTYYNRKASMGETISPEYETVLELFDKTYSMLAKEFRKGPEASLARLGGNTITISPKIILMIILVLLIMIIFFNKTRFISTFH